MHGPRGVGPGSGGLGGAGAGSASRVRISARTLHIAADRDGPTVVRAVPLEATLQVLQSHLPEVRACLERMHLPQLAGRVVLGWSVTDSGQVEGTKVKGNETGSQALAACVQDRLQSWRFPAPAKGRAEVTFTWEFLPLRH